MNVQQRMAVFGGLVLVVLIALLWLPPTAGVRPRAKARAQRIGAVNTLRSVSFTVTNANALPASVRGSGH